jgi:hypothetical protein
MADWFPALGSRWLGGSRVAGPPKLEGRWRHPTAGAPSLRLLQGRVQRIHRAASQVLVPSRPESRNH